MPPNRTRAGAEGRCPNPWGLHSTAGAALACGAPSAEVLCLHNRGLVHPPRRSCASTTEVLCLHNGGLVPPPWSLTAAASLQRCCAAATGCSNAPVPLPIKGLLEPAALMVWYVVVVLFVVTAPSRCRREKLPNTLSLGRAQGSSRPASRWPGVCRRRPRGGEGSAFCLGGEGARVTVRGTTCPCDPGSLPHLGGRACAPVRNGGGTGGGMEGTPVW